MLVYSDQKRASGVFYYFPPMRLGLSLNLGFVGFSFVFSAKLEPYQQTPTGPVSTPSGDGVTGVCSHAAYVVPSPSSGSPDCTASAVNHSAILWQSPNLATYRGNTTVTYSTLWCCSGALSCTADLSPSK